MAACKFYTNRNCYLATVPTDKTVEMLHCLICASLESKQGAKVVERISTVGPQ